MIVISYIGLYYDRAWIDMHIAYRPIWCAYLIDLIDTRTYSSLATPTPLSRPPVQNLEVMCTVPHPRRGLTIDYLASIIVTIGPKCRRRAYTLRMPCSHCVENCIEGMIKLSYPIDRLSPERCKFKAIYEYCRNDNLNWGSCLIFFFKQLNYYFLTSILILSGAYS